jgi:acyl carrier protein
VETKPKTLSIIYSVIDEMNDSMATENPLQKQEDTILYGPGSELDSLGLVNLIVSVEQEISDKLGVSLVLADEKALSQKRSPFRTVGALDEYVKSLLANQ